MVNLRASCTVSGWPCGMESGGMAVRRGLEPLNPIPILSSCCSLAAQGSGTHLCQFDGLVELVQGALEVNDLWESRNWDKPQGDRASHTFPRAPGPGRTQDVAQTSSRTTMQRLERMKWDDTAPLTLSPNFCCSSACFPMCSWKKNWDQSSVTPGRALRGGGKAQGWSGQLQRCQEHPEVGWEHRESPQPQFPPLTWATAAK